MTAARLAPGLRGGRVHTDDVAPVEWLIAASIVTVAADGERAEWALSRRRARRRG